MSLSFVFVLFLLSMGSVSMNRKEDVDVDERYSVKKMKLKHALQS